MSKRKYIAFLFFATIFGSAFNAQAKEYWKVTSGKTFPPAVPWYRPLAIASFEEQLFVSGTSTTTALFWRSSDAKNWTPATLPNQTRLSRFATNGARLFAVTSAPGPLGAHIFFTDDGVTWTEGTDPQIGASTIVNLFIQGNYLYEFLSDARIRRTSMVGSSLTWETSPCDTLGDHSILTGLGAFPTDSENFYIRYQRGLQAPVVETCDGTNRSYIGNLAGAATNRALLFQHYLFWGFDLLAVAISDPIFTGWYQIEAGYMPTPFVLNDQVHVMSPGGQIAALTLGNSFPPSVPTPVTDPLPVNCETSAQSYDTPAVWKGRTFLLACEMLEYRPGAFSVTAESWNDGQVISGHKDTPVVGLKLQINLQDSLKNLYVIDRGSSAGSNVDAVYLKRIPAPASPPAGQRISLIKTDDGHGWRLPDNTLFPVYADDELQITVDVSANAASSNVMQWSLDSSSLRWKDNTDFSATGFINGPTISLEPSQEQLTAVQGKAQLFPNPARDQVRVTYYLAETADVEVRVFNREGLSVLEKTENDKPASIQAQTILDTHSFANGIYYVVTKIKSAGSEQHFKSTLVIER